MGKALDQLPEGQIVRLTSLEDLCSSNPADTAHNIRNTAYLRFHLAYYTEIKRGHLEYSGVSENFIVPVADLPELLAKYEVDLG